MTQVINKVKMSSTISHRYSKSYSENAGLLCALMTLVLSGCWAPLRSYGIPACELGDEFRTPTRSLAPLLNLSYLTISQDDEYRLGSDDVLEISVPGLYADAETRPMKIAVLDDGKIHLPMIGTVNVKGKTLVECRKAITVAYADGFLLDPQVNVMLFDTGKVDVLVLGEVETPGVVRLPKHQSDVGHALAMAGGLGVEAAEIIEVHRRIRPRLGASSKANTAATVGRNLGIHHVKFHSVFSGVGHSEVLPDSLYANTLVSMQPPSQEGILRIPLRGFGIPDLKKKDIILKQGDVVRVPPKKDEIFYVVGKLNRTNNVRFTVGDRERELGIGLLLPADRDIDVVTAVAMAGYIDPIDSPTTVTVHRTLPDGEPLLVKVDLIKARYDRQETIFVQPGDIIYLNPDFAWWARRTLDRVINNILVLPYQYGILNLWL